MYRWVKGTINHRVHQKYITTIIEQWILVSNLRVRLARLEKSENKSFKPKLLYVCKFKELNIFSTHIKAVYFCNNLAMIGIFYILIII
jgi:hypothetical protein